MTQTFEEYRKTWATPKLMPTVDDLRKCYNDAVESARAEMTAPMECGHSKACLVPNCGCGRIGKHEKVQSCGFAPNSTCAVCAELSTLRAANELTCTAHRKVILELETDLTSIRDAMRGLAEKWEVIAQNALALPGGHVFSDLIMEFSRKLNSKLAALDPPASASAEREQ